MVFTYSANPNASILDEVRFLIQDTDANDPCLNDEEINYLILKNRSAIHSALAACYVLIAKFSRTVDEQTGKQTIYASQMQTHYLHLSKKLEDLCAKNSGKIYIGGMSPHLRPQFNDKEGDNRRAWSGNDN